jgi:N-acetylneuraminate synthase
MTIKIGHDLIGPSHAPYVIAEMSGNHNGSLERALQIVDAIAASGAQALKLQTYTPDTMTLNLSEGEFFIADPKSLWVGSSLYDLYAKAMTPWEWHAPIFERARKQGLAAFSSPFDATAVDFLESLDVPAYKIASFEILDLPLIRKAASTGKPLIISTGMSEVHEIADAVDAARGAGCKELILLKCTSTYPASPANSHLRTIPHLREMFGCEVGLSDHTLGIGAAIAAVALGATVLEKHVTLARDDGGVDSAFSLEPAELRALVEESARAVQALGQVRYGATEREKESLCFRRSLYVTQDVAAGGLLDASNVRAIRPGFGMPVKYLEKLTGMRAAKDLKKGEPLRWEHFK